MTHLSRPLRCKPAASLYPRSPVYKKPSRDCFGCGVRIVHIAEKGLRTAKADMADLARGQFIAGVAGVAHGLANGAWVDGHILAKPSENRLSTGRIGLHIGAETGGLCKPQAGADDGRHGSKLVYEGARDGIASIGGEFEAGEIELAVVFEHPLEVEHDGNLAEDLDLMLGNCP